MPMWLWKQRLKPLAEFQIIFLTCKIRGCAVNLNYDTAPYFHHHFILYAALRGLFFLITTFWAYSIRIEGDTAKRTAVDVIPVILLLLPVLHGNIDADAFLEDKLHALLSDTVTEMYKLG